MSRLHLIVGIMSYLASPIWLVFIMLGFLLALQAHFIRPEYFPTTYALFPTWPVFNPERAVRLFVGTMAVLMAPKLMSYVLLYANGQKARSFGGLFRTGVSVLLESILSALIAPVTMLMQSAVVAGILTGHDVGWNTQRRDDGSIPFGAIARRHLGHTLFGGVLAGGAYIISPPFLGWMSPVVAGLLLAIPLSALTARQRLGRVLRRAGLLTTPEEIEPPPLLQRANELTRELSTDGAAAADAFERIAQDADLQALHMTLMAATPPSRKGEYDVDLLLGLAKLNDVDSIEEGSSLLSSREKLAVLGTRAGIERLCQLATRPRTCPNC